MFRPLAPTNWICGIYCGEVVERTIPSPLLLLKPKEERLGTRLLAGLSKWRTVRKMLIRASLTAVAPKFLVLLMTNCWAREGLTVAKPGTLGPLPGIAFATLALSKW